MILALFSCLSKNHFYELHSMFFLISITFTRRNQKNMALDFTMQNLPCIIASHWWEHLHQCSVCHSG
jgi:hypothetical protein